MVALLKAHQTAALGLLAAISTVSAQQRPGESPHRWLVQNNVSYTAVDTGDQSWLNGGLGKLRRDESDSTFAVQRLLFEYRKAVTPTLFAQLGADYLHDGSSGLDLTEAFLEWRPVPRSPTRHRFKLGAFYPRLSLENTDAGWETPFSISSSAINSWIAEEVKLLGAEWSLQRRLGGAGSPHELGVFAAAFYGNDPTGTLLAWKGWGIHDRQTRWHEQLPLPPLPQLQPGTRLREKQAPYAEPFLEIDHAPGYYAGVEWRYAQRVSIQAAHYDNRADLLLATDGQYAWETYFDHLAVQISLPWDIGLMAQWMSGYTAMGPVINRYGTRPVENEFQASYLMLTRMHNGHRVSLRFDQFAVEDLDLLPDDDNSESGHAITLAYNRELSPTLRLAVEWLRVESDRPARAYLGLDPDSIETTLQVQLRWRLTSRSN